MPRPPFTFKHFARWALLTQVRHQAPRAQILHAALRRPRGLSGESKHRVTHGAPRHDHNELASLSQEPLHTHAACLCVRDACLWLGLTCATPHLSQLVVYLRSGATVPSRAEARGALWLATRAVILCTVGLCLVSRRAATEVVDRGRLH